MCTFRTFTSVSMLVYPLRCRQIVIQEFTQKSVLFPFPAEKKIILFPFQIPQYLNIYIQSPKHKLPLCLSNRRLFSETTISIRDSCFPSLYFDGKQKLLCIAMSHLLHLSFSVLTDFICIHKISSVYMFQFRCFHLRD